MSPPFYRVNHPLGQAMKLVKCGRFVHGILDSLAWMTHTDLKSSAFPNAPQKRPNRGWYGSKGVVSLPSRQKPHTSPHSWDSGVIWLCRQSIFRVSSFSSPFPKVLFFVYAAQFLHRTILPSGALITFYRTLLER